jgi:Tol biopolymer transport system component
LMTLGPFQGWPDLSLAEPDGKVTDLVQNAVDTAALFSQSGRYIFFTVITLDDSDEEALYVFDREEGSAELLKEGDSINFALLADGQLLVSVKEDDDTEVFMAEADSTDLEQLSLPDEANYSSVQSDGKHVIYALEKGSAWKLFLAGLDGGGEQELASYSDSRSKPSGMLSPNGQFALLNLRDTGDEWYVEFRDLSSDEGEAIVSDINRLRFDFSPDSRWAYVVSFKRSDADSDWETTLFVIDTSTSEVVQEIDDVINAAFSPDGSQLAYTLGAEDDAEVFIIDLGGDGETSLDEGRLGGWYP